MKLKFAIILAALTSAIASAHDVDSVPPVVVKTVPEAGANDVSPGQTEIKVTFSKEMRDGSWSWSSAWKDSDAKASGKPEYNADKKTCVLKVKLEPNTTYGYWLNSQKFSGFKDEKGHSAVPYLLTFTTSGNSK